jgi:hypothetical protein
MLAHIVGIPVEEALIWAVPVAGLGLGGLARAKAYASTRWRRARPDTRRGVA